MLLVHYIDGIRTKSHALFSDQRCEPYNLHPNRHQMNQLSGQFDQIPHFLPQLLSLQSYVTHDRHRLHSLQPSQQLVSDKYEYHVGNPTRLNDVRRYHLYNRRNHHALFGHHQNRTHVRPDQLIRLHLLFHQNVHLKKPESSLLPFVDGMHCALPDG